MRTVTWAACGLAITLGVTACGSDDNSGGTPAGGSGGTGAAAGGSTSGGTSSGGTSSGGSSSGGSSAGTGGSNSGGGGTGAVAGTAGTSGGGGTGGGNPGGDGLPVGIPTPSFGWELATDAPGTVFVDNTNSACDDGGSGTEQVPYCDLFQGGKNVTYGAGDVVHVLGGPYVVNGDYSLTANGTDTSPVIIKGIGGRILFDGNGSRANFEWNGSYAVLESLDFFHKTRHRLRGDYYVLRNVAVHNPVGAFIDFNPVVGIGGHDILIQDSEIFNNRRMNDTDSHGINAGSGSYNLWILDNEIYNNNGDSFQGCHQCFAEPPHHVYIGRNVLHDDRENAVDLKTIHDVVVSENVMYGYGSSTTSGGDAMVIGSNGFDDSTNQGPRRIWVLNNEMRDSSRAVRVEGSEDVWVIGNVFKDVGVGIQIDNKPHRDIVIAANTMTSIQAGDGINIFGCQPAKLTIENNLIDGVSDRHIDVQPCGANVLSITNNLFGGTVSVRADGSQHGSVASLDGESFAMGNIGASPTFDGATLVPAAGSPMVDAGGSLDAYYQAFTTAFGPDIAVDRAGTARPVGGAQDVGAYERP